MMQNPLPFPGCAPTYFWRWRSWLLLAVSVSWTSVTSAQVDFEQPPINYLTAQPNDLVSELQKRIDAGEVHLEYDGDVGYLRSVLKAFNVPILSQTLVFSMTSFQLRRISPNTPRALYFNEDVYVGWVHGGDVVELSAVDPRLGTNFYTISQKETNRPRFKRHTHDCLQCHGSSLTKGVPGHLVRSVYPSSTGHPILSAGTFLTDHTSPLSERWGGWYVTGRHGAQWHLGNLLVHGSEDPETVDMDRGANVTDLTSYFRTSEYLSGHSDIVALMVLEHQATMHNLIARANFLTQVALREASVINKMLKQPEDFRSESTTRRIQNAAEPVVKHLLFSGEAHLTDAVIGTSGFAEEFSSQGLHDSLGRSLRDFDLRRRLFKYPCSYLIYSPAFDQLPDPVKAHIYRRLKEVLTGDDRSKEFRHLTSADRLAILEIVRDTKPGLPHWWTHFD